MENKPRIVSLDTFRGIAIAGMILVNNQGDWGHVFPALRHAAWHGWLGADFVFPFFLFAAGASLYVSISSRVTAGTPRTAIVVSVTRRAMLIIALGLLLNLFPFFDFNTFRIPGVLQRIGLCYLFASLIVLYTGPRAQFIITVILLALYGGLLLWVAPSGIGSGSLEPCCNLPGFVDSRVFAGHTYEHAPVPGFDPEGLLGTISSIASVMIGVFACAGAHAGSARGTIRLIAAGFVLTAAGLALDMVIPINKNLWTPSYCLFMGGAATLLLSMLHSLGDFRVYRPLALPFIALGRNAIIVYVLSSLAGKSMISFPYGSGENSVTLKTAVFNAIFAPWFEPYAASTLYAAAFLAIWLAAAYIMYRRRIFIAL